jgi:iron complex outermembrane receptor protein
VLPIALDSKQAQQARGINMKLRVLLASVCVVAIAATSVRAAADELTEIIVTARKRQESILNVPVIETAIPQAQLERFQTQDLKDIQKLVPGLLLGRSVASVGTQVSLRGVGTSSLDAGIDQSVALNIDGLQLTQGLAYSAGLFDLAQVEVLKGPQALFYGKNSPGGVISLRTADPTNEFELIGRGGHEFVAPENRGELIISGPVTDTLRLRLATMYDQDDGYFRNRAVPQSGTGALAPRYDHTPYSKSFITRGTMLWTPSEQLDVRLKLNYAQDRIQEANELQLISCPDGLAPPPSFPYQFIGNNDCKLDRNLSVVSMDPAAFPGVRNGGMPFHNDTQNFGTLELNYHPQPDVTMTSTTGYYDLVTDTMLNGTESGFAATPLASFNHFTRRDFTQEFRANSEFDGPLNFTAGAFYQNGKLREYIDIGGNTALVFPGLGIHVPAVIFTDKETIDIKSYSVFAQGRYKIIPDLELAGGARWTHETREITPYNLATGQPVFVSLATPKLSSDNISPEVTLTYKPVETMTLFGSYKKGYKSGSFTVTTPISNGADISFGDEKIQGGEVGVKTRLLDRRLSLDVAAYDYRYDGLQTSANQVAANGLTLVKTLNAGSADIYGVDLDAGYRPAWLEGFGVHSAINWNHARFKELNVVPCWGGQLISEGCNQILNPSTGRYTSQSLSGNPLVRAPDWQVNFGFDYELALSDQLALAFSSNSQYSSKYLTVLGNRADFYQKGFVKTDLTVALKSAKDDRWEVAVIGKNVGDKLTTSSCSNASVATGQILLPPTIGGTTRNAAGVDELVCDIDRGREIWLRLMYKPF